MTWNVSASGTKEEVKDAITEKVTSFHNHPEVADAACKLVDSLAGCTKVSVSGSGSDTGFSLSGSCSA